MNFPESNFYFKTHEWARIINDKIRIGISDYRQDQLGDIVYLKLPKGGTHFRKGEEFGAIESVRGISELLMPISGEIISSNPLLINEPELVNKYSYQDGWLIEVKPDDLSDITKIPSKKDYLKLLKEKK